MGRHLENFHLKGLAQPFYSVMLEGDRMDIEVDRCKKGMGSDR